MRETIIKKAYARITFRNASALSIGCGQNEYSDSDLLRDANGCPLIPGSSLAGVYRSLFAPRIAEYYFGSELKETTKEAFADSKLLIYDALTTEKGRVAIKDCVKLDRYKTAVDGSKFDMEVLEPGTKFTTYVEQNFVSNEDENLVAAICLAWKDGALTLGAKSRRGLGAVKVSNIQYAEMDLTTEEGREAYLNFAMYDDKDKENAWKPFMRNQASPSLLGQSGSVSLRLSLKQRGGISIRKYTTEVSKKSSAPDMEQLTYLREDKEVPVIPGTSWAGAFRHHLQKLTAMTEKDMENYFGSVGSKEDGIASRLRFSDSEITGAKPKVLSRNAIDRFSGGTVDGALFTEKTFYDGSTELMITINRKRVQANAGSPLYTFEEDESFLRALAAAACDLSIGILSVGGQTSIGRGIFEGVQVKVNGGARGDNEGTAVKLTEADILTGAAYDNIVGEIKNAYN